VSNKSGHNARPQETILNGVHARYKVTILCTIILDFPIFFSELLDAAGLWLSHNNFNEQLRFFFQFLRKICKRQRTKINMGGNFHKKSRRCGGFECQTWNPNDFLTSSKFSSTKLKHTSFKPDARCLSIKKKAREGRES
jgi:hypothetical protein